MRRRDVLVGCGALAGSATLAGCSALPFGGGGGDGDGLDASEYTDWMPTVDESSATFTATRYADVLSVDGVPEGFLQSEVSGVPGEDLDQRLTFAGVMVLEGSFDVATIRDGIESEQDVTLQEDGEYGDYQRFAIEGVADGTVGLAEGRAVVGSSSRFEAVVDARSDDADRLVDVNGDFEALVDDLGMADLVRGAVLDTDEAVPYRARGQRVDVGEDDSDWRHVFVFASESDVEEETVREPYEERANVTDFESSVDGRVATVSYTEPTDQLA